MTALIINYNTEKIARAFQDFYNATGVNIALRRADCSCIYMFLDHSRQSDFCHEIHKSDAGMRACQNSDYCLLEKCSEQQIAVRHVCHAGLTDIAVPLYHDGSLIGYIILGELRNETDFSEIAERVKDLGVSLDNLKEYYEKLRYFDEQKTESIINVAVMLSKYILLEDMLELKYSSNIEKATDYINANCTEELSIQSISAGVNISKSVLYRDFRKYFNCTVNEYVNVLRVEQAANMLLGSELSVDEISAATGFSSASYFGKIFKKIKGMTPVKYRNTHKIRS